MPPPILSNDEWTDLIESKTLGIPSDISSDSLTIVKSANDEAFSATIDHTLLKPDATPAMIDELCDQALKYRFKSCCVNSANVRQVAARLQGASSIPCAVVGFPLGAMKTSAKAFEAAEAISDGAREIDMVINIGALKSGNYALVSSDISSVVQASRPYPVKVILETALLTEREKIAACFIAAEVGATFVKTCTGFGGGGATAEDVSLMKRVVSYKRGSVKVKASGGIRSWEKCLEMYAAGADRIGASSGAAIVEATPAPMQPSLY